MKLRMRPLLAVWAALSTLGCGADEPARPFVHVEGSRLIDAQGAPLALEGITFGELYRAKGDPLRAEGEAGYAQVAAMGMNHVRLYFNASTLEDDSDPSGYDPEALAWLDESLARAREQGLYLVLALNVPPGGSYFDCGNDAFWDSAANQTRLIELWRMLAKRYATEPAIAGYALLDPPNPSRSLEQWQELAERTTQAIRAVDREHTLFVARMLSLGRGSVCAYDQAASQSFIRVNDPNVVYEFDRAQPWSYVAQLLRPLGDPSAALLPEVGPYPNSDVVTIDRPKASWLYASDDSRPSARALKLEPDETEWTKKTFYYTVTDPQFAYALPVLQADNTSGKAFFDDILVEEVGEDGDQVIHDLDLESSDGWYFWEGNDQGEERKGTGVVSVERSGHRGRASVAISGTTSFANLAAEDWAAFPVQVGSTYRVTSWVKGENIASGDFSRVRLDFWGYSEPLQGFNRSSLEGLFTDFRAWGRGEGVPMFVNSFGTGRPTFEGGRGGLTWVSDMIDIMREQELGFVYWSYRDRDFGIYTNVTGEPDPETVNQPLVDLLTEKLR